MEPLVSSFNGWSCSFLLHRASVAMARTSIARTLHSFLLFFLLFPILLFSYERPEEIGRGVWNTLTPYFLPKSHPLRHQLDAIFKKSRVTLNGKTFKKAGFSNSIPGKYSHLVVSKHKKIKGFIFKLYLDDQNINDWPSLKYRIDGALSVKRAIKQNGYEHLFKVPKKWLYPIPESSETAGPYKKHFLLIAEDANIVSEEHNRAIWASKEKISDEFLQAFFTLLQTEGLHDSIYPFNVPFSKDGKAAFIDTERHHVWPIYWNRLLPYLSKSRRAYWEQLTAG